MNIQLYLPFPPSINKYWVRTRAGIMLTKQARAYRAEALEEVWDQIGPIVTINTRVLVSVVLFPPDKRNRDLDNYMKPLLDVLVHSSIIIDDSQIDQLFIYRGKPQSSGKVFLKIREAAPVLREQDIDLI